MTRRQQRRAYMRISRGRYRAEAMAEGFCGSCCKRPVVRGLSKCAECKGRDEERRQIKKSSMAPGTCSKCLTRPSVEGYRACAKCRRAFKRWRNRCLRLAAHARRADTSVVLQKLAHGAVRQRDLTGEIGRAHRSTLRWLAKFERDGLVERWTPEDETMVWARLTAAGRRAVDGTR